MELTELHVKIIKKGVQEVLVDSFGTTDMHIESATQLNLNFTEAAFEVCIL